MKKINILFVLFLLIPLFIKAGDIFGTISKDGRPVVKAVVTITSGNGTETKSDTTDATGYFSVKMRQLGQCKMKVKLLLPPNAETDGIVYSNTSPTGYTFILTQQNAGWKLIQK